MVPSINCTPIQAAQLYNLEKQYMFQKEFINRHIDDDPCLIEQEQFRMQVRKLRSYYFIANILITMQIDYEQQMAALK